MRGNLITAAISSAILSLVGVNAYADSPLTSTYFHEAYDDLPAFDSDYSLEFFEYLLDDTVPLEYRLAVINKAGWDINGKTRSAVLMEWLKIKDLDSFERRNKEAFGGDHLICIAYLMAMDNYFDVDNSMFIAEKALEEAPYSYSVNIIAALIKAQKAIDSDWGLVYKLTDDVRHNGNLIMDMKQEAIDKIFEYQDIYRNYYKEGVPCAPPQIPQIPEKSKWDSIKDKLRAFFR